MTKKALTALNKSIAHWERLSTGTMTVLEGTGVTDCALCSQFFDIRCAGCPVADRTGLSHCKDTPYIAADHARDAFGITSEKFQTEAKKELAFLRSLLPKKAKK